MVRETFSNKKDNKLPDLPLGWIRIKLVDSCKFLPTGVEKFDGIIEYYSTGSIQNKIFDPEGSFSFNNRPSRANRLSAEGDVFQARMKGTRKAIIIKKNLERKLFSTGFIQLRPYNCCKEMSSFLYYFIDSPLFILQRDFFATGTTQTALTDDGANKIFIQFPSLSEQSRIVARIEELFPQLDAGVASLKKVQAQLKRYRQAVLKAAFEGRLTQEWREEHKGMVEPASLLFERIKSEHNRDEKEISKRLPLDDAELFQLPEEWIWTQAQDICENITNGYTPTAEKLFEGSGEIPFIKVYNLTKTGALDFTVKPTFISKVTHETELRRSAVYPHDVLMSIVGPPMGKVSLIPELHSEWNINQAIVIYRTFPDYSRKLILYALLSDTIQKWLKKRSKTTAGQTNYTITMSRSLPIPLPPISEQSLIVNEIERHFSQIDHLESTVETSLKQAEILRQSILKRAFDGKLVPQDPNDEPASTLLESINAEKAKTFTSSKKGKISNRGNLRKKT